MDILLLSVIPGIAFVLYGFLLYITWRHGFENRVNRSFVLYLLSMMVWSLGALMMYLDRNNAPSWNRVMLSGVVVMPLAFFSFVQAFHPQKTFQRLLPVAVIYCLSLLVLAIEGYLGGDIHISERGLIQFSLGPAVPLFAFYFFLLIGLSALSLGRGLTQTRDYISRNRIRYVVLGLGFIVSGSFTNLIGSLGAYPLDIAANAVNALILAYTIFRYNLLDITIVIRKGLLYTIPTMIIGVGYFLIILTSVSLFHIVAGYEIFIVSVLIAAGVALVMQPLQERSQYWIDKLFFRERYDAGLMLERLSRTATSVLDLQRLLNMILDEVSSTVHITKTAVFLQDEDTGVFHLITQRGLKEDTRMELREDHPVIKWLAAHRTIFTQHQLGVLPQFKALWAQERRDLQTLEAELFVPLFAHNQLIGVLIVGPKYSEASYSEEEKRTLMTLANQTAIAVQNARLYQIALEEKKRSEVVLEQAFAGIIVVDQQMRIVVMNPAAKNITGYTAQELEGETIFKVFGPDMWGEDSPLRKAVENNTPITPMETTLVTPNGPRDILLGLTPIYNGYLFNFADITKIKEFSRLQSNIVANVSHELRTPLASIKGYAELLLEEYEEDNKELRRQFLNIIDNEADRMSQIVKDLLDISRLESSKTKPQMELISIGDVIAESILALAVQAQKDNITLHQEIPEHLPKLWANKELMISIVKNLVSNAIKYSYPNSRVDVVVYQQNGNIVLKVIDQGLGISEEDLPHLFTKFYRSGMAQKAGIRGTGLGLALVKEAVEVHQGSITVDSEEGAGTTFTITLPLVASAGQGQDNTHPQKVMGLLSAS